MTATDRDQSRFSVTVVIVTYNPDLDVLKDSLSRLKPQTDSIIVIDNFSSSQEEICHICSQVEYCSLPSNLGVGMAHNLGIEYAYKQKSSHVLLMDQDSLAGADMLNNMKYTIKELAINNINPAGVGSRYRIDEKSRTSDFVKISWFRFSRVACDQISYVKADFLISSGTLIPLSTIDVVGMMDESLFIDHIDTEWFLRAKNLGYNAYGSCRAYMTHSLGERTTRLWFGRWRNVPCHKPFRYYYIFRNSILLYRRHYMPFKWMLADWVRLGQNFVFFGIFDKQRITNQKMLWKGVFDGIKGTCGRHDFASAQK